MENKLWLIWKEPKSRRRYVIGELTYSKNMYVFKYIDPELNDARSNGFDFFPGFDDVRAEYKSNNELFPNIDTRLPNVARPEYLDILNLYDLTPNSSKMEILEKTKGRLLTDNFEFVPVFDKNKIEFEIAGTKYARKIKDYDKLLKINDNLILEREKENEYDKFAVKVICKNNGKTYHLGYVPRYYSEQLSKQLDKNVKYSAKIKYLNFESELNDEDVTAEVKLIFNNK